MNVRKDKTKQIYVLETTATDTKNMEFIIKVRRPCNLVITPIRIWTHRQGKALHTYLPILHK